MDQLKLKFKEKSSTLKTELKTLLKEHGSLEVGTVTLAQIYGGMRGLKSMPWETSELDAQEGIKFRGYSIPKLKELLPKAEGGKEPLPEGLFWLMLVGEIPTKEQVDTISKEWLKRGAISDQTKAVIDAFPKGSHPMTQFIAGITSMQSDSIFATKYFEGLNKAEYWDPTYEDSMNLIAKLPTLAAYIYRKEYHGGKHIAPDMSLDWSGNFAHMLGINDAPDFKSLMRIYMTIHADHEGGNASAHTAHLVGSTLSDPYLSYAGGMCSLAGPLHGLANQEVIKWVMEMIDELGTQTPSKEQIADYVQATLDKGQVIPGYGHAVLREPDPRFTAQREFAEEYVKDDDLIQTIWKVFDVVPPILQGLGKVKNPWPNVDAHSGALLVHYGMKEYSFYTVLFGVSRALGVLAAGCWSRAFGFPLERPKSVTTDWLKKVIKESTSN